MKMLKNRLFLAVVLAVGLLGSSTPAFSMEYLRRTGSWLGEKYSAGKQWLFGKSTEEKPEEVTQEKKEEAQSGPSEVEMQKQAELERVAREREAVDRMAREKEAREKLEQQKRIEELARQEAEMKRRQMQRESLLREQAQEEQELQRVLEASKKEDEEALEQDLEKVRQIEKAEREKEEKENLELVRQAEEKEAQEKLEKERQEKERRERAAREREAAERIAREKEALEKLERARRERERGPRAKSPESTSSEGSMSDSDEEEENVRMVKEFERLQQEKMLKKFHQEQIKVGGDTVDARTTRYNGKELVQISVKNQFDPDGGGAASCGYHALNNGIEVALALLKLEKKALDLQRRLFEPSIMATFTRPTGSWRNVITKTRALKQFQNDLSKLWASALRVEVPRELARGLKPEKIKELYRNALDKFARMIAQEIFSGKNISLAALPGALCFEAMQVVQGNTNYDDIRSYYIQPDQLKDDGKELLKNLVLNQGTMQQFVDISKLTLLPRPEINQRDYEWLDGDEIRMLVAYDKTNARLRRSLVDDHVSVLVYDDVSLMGVQDFDVNIGDLQGAARKSITDPQHVVIFCVGTMVQSREQGSVISGTRGHWFTLVWTQNRVYLMNSADNALKLEDENVRTILDRFEEQRRQVSRQ